MTRPARPMSTTRTDPPFTWDDYLALPESPLRHEVLDGELVVSPSPNLRHQRVLARLARALHAAVEVPRLGEVLIAPFDVKLSATDVVQPDLLVIRPDHAARLGENYLDGAPTLAIEILSPGTGRRDRGLKKSRYAAHGVAEYWIVDPRNAVVDQFVLDGADYGPATECREQIELAILPGVVVALAGVFAPD